MPHTASIILNANLKALSFHNPESAAAIDRTDDHPDFRPLIGDDGLATGELARGEGAIALSSRRQPGDEARRFAASVDLTKAAVVVVIGFGAGHHVRELARRVGGTGLVVVFEPDQSLLRSVLSHVDHSAWLASSNVRLLTDPDDRAAMVEALRGCEGLVGMGVKIVEHAPSKPRLADARTLFAQRLTEVIDSTKMTVLTSLVQVRTTIRNATQNLDRYVTTPGVDDLKDLLAGRPAVVVSAGPSLLRNVDLLSRPGVRDRVVIVAVQTVIKTLLQRGVRPHLVTALDHSEISRRFYEGLTAADVEGITLIVEPKVNPAVLEAWPGQVRTVADANLDRLLGDLAPSKGSLTAGATVAHLAYYLARHMGCDPVALIGQDLGFTDGQYYAPGAAIHEVWGGELNSFNTLEMLEWQRILRMGSHLRRASDVLGRPMFTDEQMQAYLSQFERDFKRDSAEGRTTIDATEGGVLKQHTTPSTLAEFLDRFAPPGAPAIVIPPANLAKPISLAKVEARIRTVRQSVWRLAELCRKADAHLVELIEHHQDQARVNRLIGRLDVITREVLDLDPAYSIAHVFAQTGAFNRVRSDRLIHLDDSLDPLARQRKQAERDLANVRSLGDTADQLGSLLDSSLRTLTGGPRVTREVIATSPSTPAQPKTDAQTILPIVPVFESMLQPGQLSAISGDAGPCSLVRTLARLTACPRVGDIAVVTDQPGAVAEALAAAPSWRSRVRVLAHEPSPLQRFRARQTWVARAPARACWRGGLAGATCYDECFDPQIAQHVLQQLQADAALVCGSTWEALDPDLTTQVIDRYLEDPESLRFTFTQSVPGVSPCVLGRSLIDDLASAAHAGLSASIGALLGYAPRAPVNDLIASTRCVNIPAELRDAGVCLIADSAARREALRACQSRLGADHTLSPVALAREVALAERQASELVLSAIDPRAHEHVDAFAAAHPAGLLTLRIADPSTLSADFTRLLASARAHRLCVHAHVAWLSDILVDQLVHTGVDIISVQLDADSSATYSAMTGREDFDVQVRLLETLLTLRATPDRSAGPVFVIPRITRCDTTYSEIETFYHRWLHAAGWAVIDPLPAPRPGERIVPLPLPAHAQRRFDRDRRVLVHEETLA